MPAPELSNFEEYARLLQKTVADTLALADAAKEEAAKARDAALTELAAAQDERRNIKIHAEALAEAHLEQHRKKIGADVRQETLAWVVNKLMQAGRSAEEIQEWLEVPPSMIEEAQILPGFQKLDAQDARVEYESQGRGGTIVFRRGTDTLRFYWEFGGGNALALIFVPDEEHWEAETSLPLSERLPVIDFVATRVIADQASGCRYQLRGNCIEILHQ